MTENLKIDPSDYFSIPLEDGLVVSNIKQQKVYTLNATAKFIWEMFADGKDIDQISTAMAEHFQLDKVVAEQDVKLALESWQAGGLVQSQGSAADRSGVELDPESPKENYMNKPALFELDYFMNKTKFRINYHGKILKSIFHPRLVTCANDNAPVDHQLQVYESDGQYIIMRDGQEVASASYLGDAVNWLFTEVINLQYPQTDILLYLHASCLGDGTGCILFPGYFRRGKSTLTAALLTLGLDYFSDDIVPVTYDTLKALPVPLNICLKKGSWEVIKPYYPDIYSLPVQKRYDGKPARYIPPPTDKTGSTPVMTKAIVFPKREDGAKASLQPISKLEALSLISDSNSIVSSEPERVERLVEWIDNTPTYILHYGYLDDAIEIVREMFAD